MTEGKDNKQLTKAQALILIKLHDKIATSSPFNDIELNMKARDWAISLINDIRRGI